MDEKVLFFSSMCYLLKYRGKSGQPVSLNEICFDFVDLSIHLFMFRALIFVSVS